MGLDMYAVMREGKLPTSVDFAEADGDRELHYWRKHPNLHGWMERLYREKGGKEPEFNCVNVELTIGDLDRLEAALRAGCLPPTTGFFFGVTDGTERADDLAFIEKARDVLLGGYSVYYTSWW